MNELYHHGVQGQKWGVRRYQNADGTLTEEGRRRYGYEGHMTKKGYRELKKARSLLIGNREKARYLRNFVPKEYDTTIKSVYNDLANIQKKIDDRLDKIDYDGTDKEVNALRKLYSTRALEGRLHIKSIPDIVLKDAKVKNPKEIDRFMDEVMWMYTYEINKEI